MPTRLLASRLNVGGGAGSMSGQCRACFNVGGFNVGSMSGPFTFNVGSMSGFVHIGFSNVGSMSGLCTFNVGSMSGCCYIGEMLKLVFREITMSGFSTGVAIVVGCRVHVGVALKLRCLDLSLQVPFNVKVISI